MEYSLLIEIGSQRDSWTIKVKIMKLWDAINVKNNNDLISLDMILVDEEVCFNSYSCF